MSKYRVGEVVNWFEGYAQRQKFGLIERVHELAGWPAEYTVRALKKDGSPFKKTRRLYESELRPGTDFDSCCACHEPLSHLLTCTCCYRSVCQGCAQYDGTDDTYCPECWSDMHAFLGEGVNCATPESQRHNLPPCATALPRDGQEQLQGQG